MKKKINWKKFLLFTCAAVFTPTIGTWATSVNAGHDLPFTLGNVLIPAIPGLIVTLTALFSNPRTLSN